MNKILLSILVSNLLFAQSTLLQDIEVIATDENREENIIFQKESFIQNAPMQQQITTKQAINTAGSNGDPLKAISSLAGVVTTGNDTGNDLYIHGSKPRETKFTLNHIPLGYLFHMGGIHSVIAPEATSQIDAYLGGFDVTYGDAMGGVIDILPKYPSGSNKGRVHIGLYDADFAYDAKLGEDISLLISARRSYLDFLIADIVEERDKDKQDEDDTIRKFPEYSDAQLILSYTKGEHLFSIEAITAKDEVKLHTTANRTKDPLANGKLNFKSNFTTVGARWNYIGDEVESMTLISNMRSKGEFEFFDDDFFIKSNFKENKIYHETLFDVKNHKPLIGFEVQDMKVPYQAKIFEINVEDGKEQLISESEIIEVDKTYTSKLYTGFVQDIWDISDDDHLRYGVRASKVDFQNFGTIIDPRVAYVHDFDNTLSASIAIGKYSQMPNYGYVVDEFGNAKIDTLEMSNHYALNLSKKFSDNSSIVIEPYFKSFENLAIVDEVEKYKAVGDGEAYGVDLTYRKNIDNFDIIMAYTYAKSKRQTTTTNDKKYRLEGDIPHTLQLNTSYRFSNDWRLSSLFKYHSGQPYTPIIGAEDIQGESYKRPIYGESFSKRVPESYDLDIQIGKTFKYSDSSLEVVLELMNITELFRDNIEGYSYDDEYKSKKEEKGIGALPAIHVNYRF
ncbi:MAG TPA: hypothetical protein EYM49_00595 [Campylobacterales bacterium]|nr:hypothetical protein [Campylobacterales bacterium]